ncbi:UDP-N-acetylmuramoyl-tripeptide--D-alanyl-D-alanine ligase [Altibacter sp.]|uniref:UDP-N-acetylmuramoyl-tripeptide--D-alanyl-D- alanine ligase n=1 Tax=Altibacter sp. TaxID=2024823 RepID=UPI000C92C3B9|nr:UDP-N-acetylmuramoyl-tripeptide--D-alanyl-D-alanine ligase [Altibacter sp.]MAP53314.1 UDP-N-acetylmuramoyl-tripeptide--D-alanyl-D-alanine ligase [Altibacter sp.]|tara:strand:+ start:217 stop:1497 length:1281 start_codon:yes stop_codon:yes gene_type:complete
MRIETLYRTFLKSSGVCTDTRVITKNCLFFALKGDNFNGNTFTQEALDKGAYKVVVDDIRYHKNTGETILHGDSLSLLQKLAAYHRKKLGLPIIALTGSNGKTTTKELINAVLTQKYKTVATKGNLNNHIGVPLTLLSMDASTEIGIVEMGANHRKEIAALCEIAQPDYGYITNFGKAHLEGFGGIEGVIKGKSELYQYLDTHKKTVFVNADDEKQLELTKKMQRITFGESSQDVIVQLKEASNKLLVEYNKMKLQTNLIGSYNFHNIAAAISIGEHFGVSSEKIKQAIEGYIPTNNRSQLIAKGSNTIIMDAYNANPTSMLAALENMKQATGTNKIMYLGDMFELGDDAPTEHQYIVSYLEEHAFGEAYLIGSNFVKTNTNASFIHRFETFDAFKKIFPSIKPKDSLILIKASRGMALERILELL